jgi:hypothetical protein
MRLKFSLHKASWQRAALLLVGVTTATVVTSVASILPASASTVSDQISGGMTSLTNAAARPAVSPAKALPSCAHIKYVGNRGYISVQEKNHRIQWGITMTPLKDSIGKWSVSTYLSGRKTTSGFNRTVTVGYIPHGSLAVPANKVFSVKAKVVGPHGTFSNVPNACRT